MLPTNISREDLKHSYITLKTAIRIYDAQNSTSYEEEFYSLYANGITPTWELTDAELMDEFNYLTKHYNENGSPKYDVN